MIISKDVVKLNIPYTEKIQKFLRENNLTSIQCGKYELGDDCYASISEYQTKKEPEIIYEAHEKYIDIQYLIFGQEIIWVTEKENSTCIQEYDTTNDYALYKSERGKSTKLIAGELVVLESEDLHAPGYCLNEQQQVKKIVFKIKK